MNFGYTQVLFMGSVPRINRLLTTVFFERNAFNKRINNIINYSKGVSLLYKLPFTLIFVLLYPIISNSKAA